MPRLNTRSELPRAVTEVGVFRDTSGGGSTTVGGTAPTVGTKGTLTLTSATGFAIGDWVRVGALTGKPQINRIDNLVTTTLTPRLTWRHAIAVGDAIVEQSPVPLRHLASPLRFGISGSQSAIQAEDRALTLAYLLGTLKLEVMFDLLPFNLNNLLLTLGMRDADSGENIAGSGTTAAPHRVFVNGERLRELGTLAWYATIAMQGGRTLQFIYSGCEINPAALKHGIQRGSKQAIPFRLVPTVGMLVTEVD